MYKSILKMYIIIENVRNYVRKKKCAKLVGFIESENVHILLRGENVTFLCGYNHTLLGLHSPCESEMFLYGL